MSIVIARRQVWTTAADMLGVWCNGNTADSGPAFPGSNPGTPTQETAKKHIALSGFFVSITA